jgi:hypothetical protein
MDFFKKDKSGYLYLFHTNIYIYITIIEPTYIE